MYEPNLDFSPTGPYYHKQGFWPKSKDNIAPRFAVVYAPDSKTSIRAGAGLYYDHYGEGLINTFDQNGSFGLSAAVNNPAGTYSYSNAPTLHQPYGQFPPSSAAPSATSITYPYTPNTLASTSFAITWGLGQQVKDARTPKRLIFPCSVSFQAASRLETAYVGRLGTPPAAEPRPGQSRWTTPTRRAAGIITQQARHLSKLVDQNARDNASATVSAIPYFEHVFPFHGWGRLSRVKARHRQSIPTSGHRTGPIWVRQQRFRTSITTARTAARPGTNPSSG